MHNTQAKYINLIISFQDLQSPSKLIFATAMVYDNTAEAKEWQIGVVNMSELNQVLAEKSFDGNVWPELLKFQISCKCWAKYTVSLTGLINGIASGNSKLQFVN